MEHPRQTRPVLHERRAVLIDDAALFHQLYSIACLEAAWRKVLGNAGAAGGDHVSVSQFLSRQERNLGRLAANLADGSYRPGPLREVTIPKRRGGVRTLRIPCVVDRVAQTAAACLLSPVLEEEFEDASFGYRPGRSVQQAVARIQALHAAGFSYVLDADIDDYFDSIPHDGLITRLAESLSHGPLAELIVHWLSHWAPCGHGVAQGSPLSPLLANLYLDRLDEAFSADGVRIIRFADDFVILCASSRGAEETLAKVQRMLAGMGIMLNREKTRIIDFDRGFRFLGYLFVRSMAMKSEPEQADGLDVERTLADIAERDACEQEQQANARSMVTEQEARGYSPGLRNLYVLGEGRRLSVRNQAFCVEEAASGSREKGTGEWQELVAIPHQQLDRIDLGPRAALTEQALDHALATHVPIAFLDGHGATRGWLAVNMAPRAGRHLAQARTAIDQARRIALARSIAVGRMRGQRALLRKLCREREPTPGAVVDAIAKLTSSLGRGDAGVVADAETQARIMGYEGAATAVYWKAISALAHPEFQFQLRERRPPPDPANIALNMLAWLLHRDVAAAVDAAGLHPGFGALHSVSDHHDSCIYDLMEEFRAHMIEGLFVYMTNRRILRPDMFVLEQVSWHMTRAGGDAIVRAYENRASAPISWPEKGRRIAFRRVMIEQAHALARHHETDCGYRPFDLDY